MVQDNSSPSNWNLSECIFISPYICSLQETIGVNEELIKMFRNVLWMLARAENSPFSFSTSMLSDRQNCMWAYIHGTTCLLQFTKYCYMGKICGEFHVTNWHVFRRGFWDKKQGCQVYLKVQHAKDVSMAYCARPN